MRHAFFECITYRYYHGTRREFLSFHDLAKDILKHLLHTKLLLSAIRYVIFHEKELLIFSMASQERENSLLVSILMAKGMQSKKACLTPI